MNTDGCPKSVLNYVRLLSNATEQDMTAIERRLEEKRVAWFRNNEPKLRMIGGDVLQRAYRILILKLDIDERDAPVVRKTDHEIVFGRIRSTVRRK